MTRKKYSITILILGALATISPFSIDMYLPGFPVIAAELRTTIDQIQLSLTSYLIGIAIGQLIYGPLLDRFGRQKPLYAGLTIYILASVGCALTNSPKTLIFMRFAQAIGGCAGMVAALLVRDLFPVDKIAQVISLQTLVISVSPMIAPTVGGYVTAAFGWEYIFLILAVITAVIIAACYVALPAGSRPDARVSLQPRSVLRNYFVVLKNPQFLTYALAGGIGSAAPFAYIAGSPDVFMNIYRVSEQEYGWIFAILAAAMIGSTQLNTPLLKRFTNDQLITFSLTLQTLVGSILVLGVLGGWFGKYSLIASIFIFLSGQGLNMPNSAALSLAPFNRQAGSASALLGCLRLGISAIASAAVSIFHNQTALPMVSVMLLCAVGGLGALFTGKKWMTHSLPDTSNENYLLESHS